MATFIPVLLRSAPGFSRIGRQPVAPTVPRVISASRLVKFIEHCRIGLDEYFFVTKCTLSSKIQLSAVVNGVWDNSLVVALVCNSYACSNLPNIRLLGFLEEEGWWV